MNDYLDTLNRLYLDVPKFENGSVRDLRKIFDEYISIFVSIATNENYKHSASQLHDGFEDIDILISGSMKAKSNEEKEFFYTIASKRLKGDIRSLIEIIN